MKVVHVVPLLIAVGCGDRPPAGVSDVTIEDPVTFHEREGFVQMVPPIHLPSFRSDADTVEVWIRVPDGGKIEAPDRRLEFPPGTIADRVEVRGLGKHRQVVDIRGAKIEADGTQTFHVYRPTAPGPAGPMFGLEWKRRDAEAHKAATDRFIAKLAALPPATKMKDDQRQAFLDDLRGKNQCLPCHEPKREQNVRQNDFGAVNRGTDHSGFFTPSTVLWDEIPLESYGKHDLSLTDPAISVTCGDAKLEGRTCTNGQVPVGKWSFVRAQERNPERARQVCAARRYLAERMSPAARSRFEESLTSCNQGQETEY